MACPPWSISQLSQQTSLWIRNCARICLADVVSVLLHRLPISCLQGFASMDKTGCAMWTADVTCPTQTQIVATTRVQCRKEVKSLRKELIAEGFLGLVPIADREEWC